MCNLIFRYCGQIANCSTNFIKSVYTGRAADPCAICLSDDLYENGGFAHHRRAGLNHMAYHRDCLAAWFNNRRITVARPLQEPNCPSHCSTNGTYFEDDLIPDATNLPGLIKRIDGLLNGITLALYDPRIR